MTGVGAIEPSRVGAIFPGVARHARRRGTQKSDATSVADAPTWVDARVVDASIDDGAGGATDWFGPTDLPEDDYTPRLDVSLAAMLMLGANSWQRIDGMGMARQALEAPPTGDPRHDLSQEERFEMANGRAWCLLVHADLGHHGRRDDPFVLADVGRHLGIAYELDPLNPRLQTTLALFRLRQGRLDEAKEIACRAVDAFGVLSDDRRSGRTQGAAVLALVTLALVSAQAGEPAVSTALTAAARAVRSPLDVDDAAFGALLSELERPDQRAT
jgi:hypothetical protein